MACILLGMVLSSLDSSIANIALPVIAGSLASSDAATVYVVNGYQLAGTICLLPVAALSEALGLKRVYATGLVLFTLSSLTCALSPTLTLLVFSRVMQGAGGACMSVAGMALVRSVYPRSIVARGFALIALAVAVSGALGPSIAAMILAVASWHWLFLVNVPLGLAAIPVFLKRAPAGEPHARRFDWTGALLNALAIGLMVTGVGSIGVKGVEIAGAQMLAGVLFFAILVWQQTHRTSPLLPLDLLRIPVFALSVGTSMCSYAAQILAYVSLPFFFEKSLHLSPVATGLLLTPWPLLVALAAPVAGRLVSRYPAAIISSIGMLLLASGLLLMTMLPSGVSSFGIVWRLALCGIGFGLFQTPNNTAMMTSGPVERSGAAAGMNAVARYLGWSLGSAIAALIFGLRGSDATVTCLGVASGIALLGSVFSAARLQGRAGTTQHNKA
jgi:DHA2 family multidrug resistance protein-like MFS transporter